MVAQVDNMYDVNEREDNGGCDITDGQVGDMQMRGGMVASQMDGWMTCE